jgi:hypothetical protein
VFWWQSPKKSITHSPQRNQPVGLEKIKVAGQEIKLKAETESKEDLEGDDDWMKNLTVTLKNTSDKNIVYALLVMNFPETAAAGPMSHPLHYGRYPKSPDDLKAVTALKPGEEAEITLAAAEYDNLKTFLKSMSFSNVNSFEIKLDSVIFDDDLLWFGGILMRRDPNDPKQWHTIGKQ